MRRRGNRRKANAGAKGQQGKALGKEETDIKIKARK